MAGETHPGMQCVEVEALLAEALDGTLQGRAAGRPSKPISRAAPPAGAWWKRPRPECTGCKGLDEAEPPATWSTTSWRRPSGRSLRSTRCLAPRGEGWFEKLKARLAPVFAPVATPRFAMSFGMAFFSITMLLGIAGFHMSDLRHLDLSSKGIMKTYYDTEARIIRYYENMRLVYEIESRVRDLKRAATPETDSDNKQQQQQQQQEAPATKNPSKSEIRQEQDRNAPKYSRENGQPELAVVPAAPKSSAAVRDLTGGAFGRAAAVPFPSQLASARVNGEFVQQARLNRRTV